VELKANLGRIRLEKQHAETRLRRNRETSKRYDAQIGPFDKMCVFRRRRRRLSEERPGGLQKELRCSSDPS
jgi:hypothetical protein